MHDDLHKSDLINQNALLLCPEDHCSELTATQLRALFLVSEETHVLLQSCREHVKKVFVHFPKFLHWKVFETERSSFNDATDVVFFNVEGEYFHELQDFRVERMVINFEMTRAYVHPTTLPIWFHREEFLQDEVAILEIRVVCLKLQFYEHVIVLVVEKAETIAFKHFAICHAPITEIYLWSLDKRILCSGLDDEVVLFWHVLANCIPYIFRFFFAKRHIDCSGCFSYLTWFSISLKPWNSILYSLLSCQTLLPIFRSIWHKS